MHRNMTIDEKKENQKSEEVKEATAKIITEKANELLDMNVHNKIVDQCLRTALTQSYATH